MRRRQLLKIFGVSSASTILAGCSTRDGGDTNSTNAPQPETKEDVNSQSTRSPQPAIEYSLQLSELTSNFPLEYSAELLEDTYNSPNQPITISITISNPTEETYYFADARQALFTLKESEQHSFRLFPKDDDMPFEKRNGCWFATQFYGMNEDYVYEELQAGEETTQELILAAENQSYCPNPPEQIVFTTDVQVSKTALSETHTAFQPIIELKKI